MCAPPLQLVRECKEVLKGGLLMKQYYQFMLRGVASDAQGLQTNADIDEFEEDLHKMLMVRPAMTTSSVLKAETLLIWVMMLLLGCFPLVLLKCRYLYLALTCVFVCLGIINST